MASLRPIKRRNMQALPPRRVTVLQRSDKNRLKKITGTQAKVQGLQKGARQLKSRKPLRKTQGQASFLDRHVRNMENRRGPLNRRIKRYSILQQLNFGATSFRVFVLVWLGLPPPPRMPVTNEGLGWFRLGFPTPKNRIYNPGGDEPASWVG